MKKSVIVSGEASETDSDTEMQTPISSPAKSAIHGEVIKGEDSESEEEQTIGKNMTSATGTVVFTAATFSKESNTFDYESKYDSLLHNKLLECNKSLHVQLSQFTQHNITEATKSLLDVEQQLLQSQLTLEGAITSLRSLNVNSVAIRNKLKDVLDGDFLKTIKTAK